jgi:hypothetical protein
LLYGDKRVENMLLVQYQLGENIHRGHLKTEFLYSSSITIESVVKAISTSVNMFSMTFFQDLRNLM